MTGTVIAGDPEVPTPGDVGHATETTDATEKSGIHARLGKKLTESDEADAWTASQTTTPDSLGRNTGVGDRVQLMTEMEMGTAAYVKNATGMLQTSKSQRAIK